MSPRPLGSTGLSVSPIGLGTTKLGRTRGLKVPGAGSLTLPTDEQATALLRSCAECGVNLIDTAPAYGISEERIGGLMQANRWFAGTGASTGREGWVVCSKAGEEFDEASETSRFDFSPEAIRASVERSLHRLRLDTLDVVLLHSDGGASGWRGLRTEEDVLSRSGAIETLRDLKREGKARAFGASTKTVAGGLRAVALGCDVVMVTLNARERDDEAAIGAARNAGVGVLIKKALASGHLTGGSSSDDPAGVRAPIRFALQTPGVSAVVIGTTNPSHLLAAANAAD